MKHDNRPIGIFDSGLGGLTVAAALREQLPGEHILYLGDNARVPYGSRSKDTIIQYAMEDAAFLIQREVKCVVIACNTVSSVALPHLQEEWPEVNFIGVVEAGVHKLLQTKRINSVLVIGTAATVNSDSYRMQIHRQRPGIDVRSTSCPLFVPLVEEGIVDGEIAERVAHLYLDPELDPVPGAIILGCTHYPLLKDLIAQIAPSRTRIIDSAVACAEAVQQHLTDQQMTASARTRGTERFFVTDMPASFFTLARRFFGYPIQHVDKVKLT